MITQGEDVEAHALKERGWSVSAIAQPSRLAGSIGCESFVGSKS